jgi:peptidoglycan DL-endopeptidase CwlO
MSSRRRHRQSAESRRLTASRRACWLARPLVCGAILLGALEGLPKAIAQTASEKRASQTTSEKVSPQTASGTSSGRSSAKKKSGQTTARKKAPPETPSEKSSAESQSKKSSSQAPAEKSPDHTPSEKASTQAPAETASLEATPSEASAQVTPKSSPAVIVSALKPEDIQDFDKNPPEVQQLLTSALELTERGLGYVYGSADPLRGGMDCSGTIYFLLQKAGIADAPRSASEQYVWVRKANTFQVVISNRSDSFEFNALRPGDLLFWTGTYAVKSDPPVTHSMIYLGKAHSDGRPLMVGASDGRTYRGEQKFGVSVFDFVMPKSKNARDSDTRFIGYAKIPR